MNYMPRMGVRLFLLFGLLENQFLSIISVIYGSNGFSVFVALATFVSGV
jgi:hypothetical protein